MAARRFAALWLSAFIVSACSSGKERAGDSGYAYLVPVVDRIMQKLDDLTANVKIKPNIATRSIRLSLQAILAGKLHINIMPALPVSALTGIGFQFDHQVAGYAPSLVVNPKVLESYDRGPSIILSAFAHEMQHAADFFSDPDYYVRVSNNAFERYLFELDSYLTEAVFIDQYLVPAREYRLTRFELFLHTSWKTNGMNEFSEKLQGYDRLLARELLDINRVQQPVSVKAKKLQRIMQRVAAVDVTARVSAEERFGRLTRVRTLTSFSPQVLYDALVIEAGRDLDHDVATGRFPAIYAELNTLANLLSANAEFYNAQADSYRSLYDPGLP